MGPEPRQSHDQQPPTAEEFAALTARVYGLERQLAQLHGSVEPISPMDTRAASEIPVDVPPPPLVEGGAPPFGKPLLETPTLERPSLESRIGAQLFSRIGIAALLIGATWFLKLAIDNQWIGPVGRILAGLLSGAGLVVWSERFRRKGFPAFSYSLNAVGTGVLYLSLWAAFQLFHLLPSSAALFAMLLVTAWNAYVAWIEDAELLAVYALAGGLATPLLLSTGGNHEIFLFTYLLAIDLAAVLLVRLKPWPRLLVGAFPLTIVYFVGWYMQFYAKDELAITSVFIVLFFTVFAAVAYGRHSKGIIAEVLLPLANAAFVSLAFYSVLQDSGHHGTLPWMMLVLAAVYLGLLRLPQTRVAAAIHLSIAIIFLIIAIPLKASGHWITVGWLAEGVALIWVATRVRPSEEIMEDSELYAARVLRWLAAAAMLLGLCGIVCRSLWIDARVLPPFFNHNFATALVGVAAFAVAAWIAIRAARDEGNASMGWRRTAMGAFIVVDLIAGLICLREVATSWAQSALHIAFHNADLAMALVGLATLAAGIVCALSLSRNEGADSFWLPFAGVSIAAFNVIGVLTGVREIAAIWSPSLSEADGGLKQALAISGFLMLYGAVLLAAGFWRRSAWVRWQALVLLVFTIGKTFLYDVRSLSQGYRVVSFLGLGALLMVISFAYQKDWLALREPAAPKTLDEAHR